MNRVLLKIASLLVVLIFLPLVIFTAYQLSSLTENEKTLEDIYANQLESVLFSVNQYSDNVVSSWAGMAESILLSGNNTEKKLEQMSRDFPSLRSIYISDITGETGIRQMSGLKSSDTDKNGIELNDFVRTNQSALVKLSGYYKNGYRKIESFFLRSENNLVAQYFISGTKDGKETLCIFVVNEPLFIRDVISRRLVMASGEKFTIAVISDKSDSILYSNFRVTPEEITRKSELWVLKGYSLGIAVRGETVTGAIKERTRQSLFLLIAVNILFIIGLVFVFLNIRKQIRLAQIKSDFVSNVSHELRTPLALITMFSETLETGRVRTEEKKQEYYGIISAEANRLSKIVNSILNFSQIESGKRKYHFDRISLGTAAEEIIRSYSYHLKNKGFTIETEIDIENSSVSGDKEALSEMIVNLLDNAIKYSDSEKYIRVSVISSGKTVILSVTDKGIGIAEKDKEQIFEKFYRASGTLVHNTKGTGLGLAIVKHIVDAHKGKINVISSPGKGSEFNVFLPLV